MTGVWDVEYVGPNTELQEIRLFTATVCLDIPNTVTLMNLEENVMAVGVPPEHLIQDKQAWMVLYALLKEREIGQTGDTDE